MICLDSNIVRKDVVDSVGDFLRGGVFDGSFIRKFECALGGLYESDYACVVNSGTSALMLALRACGFKKGSEIITSPLGFVASANAILSNGLRPVFVDVDPKTFNVSPDAVSEAVTSKTRGLLSVDMYGLPCDMAVLRGICNDNNLLWVSDSAQSLGSSFKGIPLSVFADMICLSFHRFKNVSCFEGGAVVTRSVLFDERVRKACSHGGVGNYVYDSLGFNFRMPEICAVVGYSNLMDLKSVISRKMEIVRKYDCGLKSVITPFVPGGLGHAYGRYSILCEDRDGLKDWLREGGVESGIFYPEVINRQPFYRKLGFGSENLPVAYDVVSHVLSLPVHADLSDEDVSFVVDRVNSFDFSRRSFSGLKK